MNKTIRNLLFVALFTLFNEPINAGSDIYKISLIEESIQIPNFKFSIDSIIDLRPNKYFIGTIQKGLGNKRMPVDFASNITQELNYLFIKSGLKNPSKPKISLVINYLWINEYATALDAKGLVDLNVSFVKRTSDGIVILNEQEVSLSESVFDTRLGHSRRIAEALKQAFEKFNKLDTLNYKNELLISNKYNPDSSIVLTNQPKDGVFRTCTDLLYNRTDNKISNFKNIEFTPINVIVKDENKDVSKIFAFVKDKNIYINSRYYSNYNSESSSNKNGFSFGKGILKGNFIFIKDEIVDIYGQAVAVGAFGIIGAIASANMKVEKEFFLDLRKGTILTLNRQYVKLVLSEYPDLLAKFLKQPVENQDNPDILRVFVESINRKLLIK